MPMSYQQDLQNPLWAEKRLEILERDEFKCTRCGVERPTLKGLVTSYGIWSYTEIQKKSYRIAGNNYDTLTYGEGRWLHVGLEYIGDKNKPFEINKLRFTQKFDGQGNHPKLICFYEEVLNGNCLVDHNVHHKYYMINHKPWEYPNDALICLCMNCHKITHEETTIPVYLKKNEVLYNAEICDRCSGSGYLEQYHYYLNGVCFKCGGEGVLLNEEI